jgi:hypothetical protein
MVLKHKIKLNNLLANIKYKKKTSIVSKIFISDFNDFNTKQLSKYLTLKEFTIDYLKFVLYVSFKNSNIFMHLFDSLGNQIKFYSITSLLKEKKSKIKKTEILKTFYQTLLTKHFNLITNSKIELITNKDLNFLVTFADKLKQKVLLNSVKLYSNIPYNGCRRKKKK